MYQRKVDVDMLNAVKGVLADVSSVSPSSEQRVKCTHVHNSLGAMTFLLMKKEKRKERT